MHPTYSLFLFEAKNNCSLPEHELLRHYRKWQKSTHGEYKTMSEIVAANCISTYIVANKPLADMLLLNDCAKQLAVTFSSRLMIWLGKKEITVHDTLDGYFITKQGFKQLERYCRFNPLRKLFNLRVHHRLGEDVPVLERDYQGFKQRCSKMGFFIEKIEFLKDELAGDDYYQPEDHRDLMHLLDDWIAVNYCNRQPKRQRCARLKDAAKEFKISEQE